MDLTSLVLGEGGGQGQVQLEDRIGARCEQIGSPVQKLDVDLAGAEGGVGQQAPMEALVGRDPHQDQLVQSPRHPPNCLIAVGGPDNELCQQRVVIQRHVVTGLDARIPAHTRAAGDPEILDSPGGRQKPVARVFAGDAALEGPSARRTRSGCDLHRKTACDPKLLAYQIHTVDQLGDRVFDLDSRVHLEKVECAVGREQKLAGAGAAIGDGAGRRDRRHAHRLAE